MIYEKEFISFLNEVFSSARISYACDTNVNLKNTLSFLLYALFDRFFLEAISYVSVPNGILLSCLWCSVSEFFKSDYESSKTLITKFTKDPTQFFELLVKCPEASIRNLVGKSVLGAYIKLTKTSEPLLLDLINYVIGIMGYELASQWSKFSQFFDFLKDIVESANENLLLMFYERDFVTSLLDFYLEKNSPVAKVSSRRYQMGNSIQLPSFTSLMKAVVHLVLRADFVDKAGTVIISPYKEGTLSVRISDSALKCLQCEELVPKYLKSGGKIEEIVLMVKHMCYLNKKSSKIYCRAALLGIGGTEVSKISQYFLLIFGLLSIEDKFQALRTECLLGYPKPIYKVGYGLCATIDIEDDVNCYVSVIVEPTRDKSLLQALWSDRKRSEKLITLCLKMLLTEFKTNKVLYDYMKTMPPPCYLFETYLDWVPKFLQVYSKMTLHMTSTELKERDDSIDEVNQLYDEYKIRAFKEGVVPRQFYIIGKTLDTRELKEKGIIEGKVKVVVTEIVTEVYESKPMGEYNAALTGRYLIDHFNHISNNVNMIYEDKIEKKAEVQSTEVDTDKSEEVKERNDEVDEKRENSEEIKREETKIIVNENITSNAVMPVKPIPFKSIAVFHKIQIINNEIEKITAKIYIKPKEGSYMNFYCPILISACKDINYSETAFIIQKDDITKDFGEYEIGIKFKLATNPSFIQNQLHPQDPVESGNLRCKE